MSVSFDNEKKIKVMNINKKKKKIVDQKKKLKNDSVMLDGLTKFLIIPHYLERKRTINNLMIHYRSCLLSIYGYAISWISSDEASQIQNKLGA